MSPDLARHYRGVRVTVLGGSGFIGRWVARALSEAGADLCLPVRDRERAAAVCSTFGIRGELLEMDLAKVADLRSFLGDARPSVTFNLAGYGVDPTERDETAADYLNGELPEVICDALAANEAREPADAVLVHAGSALEYGSIAGDLSEDSAPSPTTLYGRSKLRGTTSLQRLCRKHSLRGLTARLFTVYGPGEHPQRLLPTLLAARHSRNPVPLTAGTQRRDFTYVEDVAEGLLRLGATRGRPGEIVNLATGILTPVRRFVETAAAVLAIPGERLLFGDLPIRGEEMEHSEVALVTLKRLTGWRPQTSVHDGILRTRDFERADGAEAAAQPSGPPHASPGGLRT